MKRLTLKIAVMATALSIGSVSYAKGGKGEGGKKVLILEETVVEGRLQRPEAFYVLQNARLAYEKGHKKRVFLGKIIEAGKGRK